MADVPYDSALVARRADETVESPMRRALRRLKRRKGAVVGLVVIAVFVVLAVFAPLISPYDPAAQSWTSVRKAPSALHWFGTDDVGRDVLARIIYGFRISVLFGLILTAISSVIGVAAGAIQGYSGGWVDLLFQRFIEIWTAIPSLYLLLIISSVLVPGFFVLLGILLLFSWVSLVGLVRAEFLRARNFEYVQAARALGVSNAVIMFRHLLPNVVPALVIQVFLTFSFALLAQSGLAFLGIGVQPPNPAWGSMLAQATNSAMPASPASQGRVHFQKSPAKTFSSPAASSASLFSIGRIPLLTF